MSSSTNHHFLRDVCSNVSRRFLPPQDEKVWFINTGDVFRGRFLHHDFKNWHELPGQAKKAIKKGDVLYSEIRPGNGRFAFVDHDFERAVVSTKFLVLESRPNILPKYLYYLITSSEIQSEFKLIADSRSATFPQITFDSIAHVKFYVPELKEQKQIVDLLDAIENLIKINNEENTIFEEIAKAIYKSWFVDFDPVRAKAEGRPTGLPSKFSDLFPNELIDSAIGEIPKGWKIVTLGSQLSFVLGGDWGKSKFSEETPNKCYCIRGADIANLQSFETSKMPVRFLKESSFGKRKLKPWDVVFEISGGSSTQSTGRTVFVTPEIVHNYDLPLTTSNFCRLLRFQSKESSLFHYMAFRNAYDRDEYFQYETGTTGIKNFGFKYFSEETQYVFPSQKCLTAFADLVSPLFERSGVTMHENVTLFSLRDTLLPKLISGELRIPNAEKLLEEASV